MPSLEDFPAINPMDRNRVDRSPEIRSSPANLSGVDPLAVCRFVHLRTGGITIKMNEIESDRDLVFRSHPGKHASVLHRQLRHVRNNEVLASL